jgi:hypothetical protein
MAQLREKEKSVRAQSKYDALSALEVAKMKHREREGECQRQHELMMMERQIELERICRGGPSFGAPPAPNVYDPGLF